MSDSPQLELASKGHQDNVSSLALVVSIQLASPLVDNCKLAGWSFLHDAALKVVVPLLPSPLHVDFELYAFQTYFIDPRRRVHANRCHRSPYLLPPQELGLDLTVLPAAQQLLCEGARTLLRIIRSPNVTFRVS